MIKRHDIHLYENKGTYQSSKRVETKCSLSGWNAIDGDKSRTDRFTFPARVYRNMVNTESRRK